MDFPFNQFQRICDYVRGARDKLPGNLITGQFAFNQDNLPL